MRKIFFTKKNLKNSESSPGCILRFLMVLDLLGRSKPIKTQHFMIFRHFEIILIGISMNLRQILFNKLETLSFFENFLRNCPKFVYLWKISILSMNIFRAVRNFCLTKFWDFFSNSGQSLLKCSQICWFLVNFLNFAWKISIPWQGVTRIRKKSQNLTKTKFRSYTNVFTLKMLNFHK